MNNDNKRSVGDLGLVGDIDGTDTRFALWHGQRLESIEVLVYADCSRPELAVRDYLARIDESVTNVDPVRLACVGPVEVADFRFTSNYWVINRAAFHEELGLDHLLLVSDFGTMAWATLWLSADELVQVRADSAQADCTRLIIGPGIGFGVGSLPPLDGGCWEVPSYEGGHVDLSVTSPRDFVFWQDLQARYGHVFAEHTLSGNSLLALYEISCALDGVAICTSSAVEIGALATADDAQADAVLEHFFLWPARVADNAVLTVDALSGVYITGDTIPYLLGHFITSGFAEALARRSRTSGAYLQDVLVWVITAEHPGLFGAGVALQQTLDVED